MKHIFKHLRKSWKALVIIVVLLAVQAVCDLSLPDYTSRIINVGVQQSGIENAAPTVLKESTMQEFLLLTNDKDASVIEKSYKVLEYNNITGSEKEKYEKKYPILKKENVYLLKNISEKEKETLSDILSRPMFARYMLTSNSAQSKQVQEQIKQNMPEAMRTMDIMTILKSLPKEQVKQMQKETEKSFAKIPDSIISQSAISSVKEEYQKVFLQVLKC